MAAPNRFPSDQLPKNFSPAEHFQDQVKRLVNPEVARYFRDVGDESWTPGQNGDLSKSPRASIRLACSHLEPDTIDLTIGRLILFYLVTRRDELVNPPIYGVPIPGYQQSVKFLPQISLFFRENRQDLEPGQVPITGEISFRLKANETITESSLEAIGRRIKSEFPPRAESHWQKGRDCMAYRDLERNPPIQLKILCGSKAAGRDMVEAIFRVLGESPNWAKAHFSQNEQEGTAYPVVPGSDTVLGRSRKLPRRRPLARVKLQYAVAHLWPVPNPIPIYDTTGRFAAALVRG